MAGQWNLAGRADFIVLERVAVAALQPVEHEIIDSGAIECELTSTSTSSHRRPTKACHRLSAINQMLVVAVAAAAAAAIVPVTVATGAAVFVRNIQMSSGRQL